MGQEQITKNADISAQKQQERVVGRPWEKGQSGNPAGRPPGSVSITAAIKIKLLEIPKDRQDTYLDILVDRIIKKAVAELDPQIIKQIWSYIDGPPGSAENPDPAQHVMNIIMHKNSMEVQKESGDKILA